MPLMVAILAAVILREAFTKAKWLGFALILPGVFAIAWDGSSTGSQQTIGHALFLGSGLAWACYTVAMRGARLDGLHAAAIAAVGALVLYVPAYWFAAGGESLTRSPWPDIALQAVVQGLLTAIISLLLYGRAVAILGASSGAAFAALCPATTALMAIPILGEWPSAIDWMAIVVISAGVYIVSGGPLPRPRA
jgi:drug/metabolite transporter (DMT)-like permease